jgi:hypothetical protein
MIDTTESALRHALEIAGEVGVHDIVSRHRLRQLRHIQHVALDDADAVGLELL